MLSTEVTERVEGRVDASAVLDPIECEAGAYWAVGGNIRVCVRRLGRRQTVAQDAHLVRRMGVFGSSAGRSVSTRSTPSQSTAPCVACSPNGLNVRTRRRGLNE